MTTLNGHLHLVCAAEARGTFLAEQSFAAPMHISKPYWDGETLLVNVVNQTAGIFGGDVIRTRVEVRSGARVLLSSPSAARFHPSRGRESRLEQHFFVRAGGSLDVFPEISIPQKESRSFQRTTMDVEPGGELVYLETLTPGRVASGETFAFERYAWATDVRVGGQLVHRERAAIMPGDRSVAGLRALFPASYHAGFIVISPGTEKWTGFPAEVAALGGRPTLLAGASKLTAHGWSIRLLAADSLALRDGLHRARALIYQHLDRKPPDLRRNGDFARNPVTFASP